MLTLKIEAQDFFDDKTQMFITTDETTISLEHSLVSVSKWESKHHKPFLEKIEEKTHDEMIDYIKCMTITQNVNPLIYDALSNENIVKITNYINDPMTATWFNNGKGSMMHKREIVTSELIYYWMIALQIPMECQKWHLNRLLTLIKVCDSKQESPKKMNKNAIRSQNAALNASRKARLGTRG